MYMYRDAYELCIPQLIYIDTSAVALGWSYTGRPHALGRPMPILGAVMIGSGKMRDALLAVGLCCTE